MRVLFTFSGGRGHFEPLVPLARTAAGRGHDVAFAVGPGIVPIVEAAGFATFGIGAGGRTRPLRGPLLPLDAAREEYDVRERFIRRAAHERATAILPLIDEWRPHVAVCDEMDFGAAVAAERAGLPHALALVLASDDLGRAEVVAEPVDELRAEHGLPPDPNLSRRGRRPILSPFPPAIRRPPASGSVVLYRSIEPPRALAEPPPWTRARAGAPTVYFTLGTEFNKESGDLFSRVLTGLRDLAVNVLVTVGPHVEPAELGPQPEHVHVTQFIPQALVLPHCDAVVAHGGAGSIMGALAHGLPMVLIPMGADQPGNAARCAHLGVARVLDPVGATPDDVRAAVSAILAEPSVREAAGRLRDEIAALPDPAEAVSTVEALGLARA